MGHGFQGGCLSVFRKDVNEQSWREFEIFHDAMKEVSKDKGPETLVELIDIWKKNPEATFVVFHPVTGMTL